MITRAVIVQTMTVSMNGSSRATRPSLAGRSVLTAEWAIGADPTPASFENTPLLIPCIIAPITPPAAAEPENASVNINPIEDGISPTLTISTVTAASI